MGSLQGLLVCLGYIGPLREGLEVVQNTTPKKVVHPRKPKIGSRDNRKNKKPLTPRTACVTTCVANPEWLADIEAIEREEMAGEVLFARHMESITKVKRIVGSRNAKAPHK